MDSKISEHFTPEKYPEFSTWTASMSRADAEEYVMESQVRETLYHETFPPRAAAICGDGVDVTKSTDTVFFAAGHYMAAQRDYAEKRFGEEMLEQKALLKNPFEVKSQRDFLDWQDSRGFSSFSNRVRVRLSTLELLDLGYDGLHILEDTPGIPNSESWLAFHPRQVVTLL